MVRIRDYIPAALVLAFSVLWAGGLMVWPRDGEPVAAIYPIADGHAAFAEAIHAGADAILGFGVLPNVVVARSERPDFVKNLYDSGALAVVRAPAAAECVR